MGVSQSRALPDYWVPATGQTYDKYERAHTALAAPAAVSIQQRHSSVALTARTPLSVCVSL